MFEMMKTLDDEEEKSMLGAVWNTKSTQKCSPCGLARVAGSLMVFVVLGLVSLSYWPMVKLYGDGTLFSAIILFPFHVLVALLLVSYFQTVLTDPGTVPKEWHDKVETLVRSPYVRCSKSGFFKPPRSHFCGVTRRLVLNMDHFCPWVNNCVGFFNRKFFILFVAYAAVTCAYAAVFLGYKIYVGEGGLGKNKLPKLAVPSATSIEQGGRYLEIESSEVKSMSIGIMCMMGAIIDAVFAFTLSVFAMVHIWMAARNQTTIEGPRASRAFRLSTEKNLRSVFGPDKKLWWLPVYGSGPCGDGVVWELNDGRLVGHPVEAEDLEMQVDDSLGCTETELPPLNTRKTL